MTEDEIRNEIIREAVENPSVLNGQLAYKYRVSKSFVQETRKKYQSVIARRIDGRNHLDNVPRRSVATGLKVM